MLSGGFSFKYLLCFSSIAFLFYLTWAQITKAESIVEKLNLFHWVELVRIRALSCIRQPFVLQETEVPLVSVGVRSAFHLGRRLLLSDTVAGIRWGGEIWHPGDDSLSIRPVSCRPVPPQMAGQQAHHFTSACQQPCCSELCVCRQKGPERAAGGQYGPAYAVSNELEPVAVVVERAHGFTWSSE